MTTRSHPGSTGLLPHSMNEPSLYAGDPQRTVIVFMAACLRNRQPAIRRRGHDFATAPRLEPWQSLVMLYSGNCEPALDDLLDDPIVRLVMARDQLAPETVRRHFAAVRWLLRARRDIATSGDPAGRSINERTP